MPTSKKQLNSRMFNLFEEISYMQKELQSSSNLKLFNVNELSNWCANISTMDLARQSNELEDGITILENMKKLMKLEEQRRKYEYELQKIEKKEAQKEERKQKDLYLDKQLALQRKNPYLPIQNNDNPSVTD